MNEQIQEIRYLVGEAWKGEYNSATSYGNANVVQDPTGLSVYRSLKPGNVGHPLTDTNWWFCIINLSSIKAASDRIAALNTAIAHDESLRVAAEQLRQQKEAQREAAETQRNEAEQNRINAEQQRVTKESQRETNEQQRITAEQGRVTAENNRVAAEQARVQAETLRNNAEDERALAETNRAAAEQQRIANEQTRISQEQQRETKEAERQQTFVQSQAARQEAYEQAEAARNATFDEAETERDAKVDAKVADITNLQAQIGYFICDTASATAAKTIAATGYALTKGGNIRIKMTNANTVNNATLNINSTGAKPLFYEGVRASSTNSWAADDVLEIYYDGTNYQARNISPTFKTGEKVYNVGVDDEPTAGSDNLVKSGGVYDVSKALDIQINGGIKVATFNYDQYILHGYMYAGLYDGELRENASSDYTEPITIPSEAVGGKLKIALIEGIASNTRACNLYDSNGTKIATKYKPRESSYPYTVEFEQTLQEGMKFAISYDNRYTKPTVVFSKVVVGLEERIEQLEWKGNTIYIAPGGSDANVGTSASPKKTVMNAVLNGASTIIVKDGEYQENINISSYKNLNFRLIADVNAAPIFKNGTTIVGDGSEVQDSTYTNVYSIPLANEPATDWIYQHLVDDVTTLIPSAEIHPLQRGKKYRCDSTRIIKITSSDSLDTIKSQINSDAQNGLYKWHYRDGTLYFSRPSISSSAHPIIIPSEHCFYNNEPTNRIFISGINFYYGNCEIQKCDDVIIQNCTAKYVVSNGAFRWNRCRNIRFIKCEAARAKTGNGDGFNGASAGTALLPVNSSVYLIDCWAHDNNDDGYSDHDGCEAQIIRGLYEYNQKAGITPSYGSHCVATQVISRRNINGFLYTGTLRGDLGLNGNALFIECLAENNTQSGFRVNGVGNENVPNSIECIDCVSIGNLDGYKNAENNGQMILRDCKAKNNTNNVNGTATIINSQLLSE